MGFLVSFGVRYYSSDTHVTRAELKNSGRLQTMHTCFIDWVKLVDLISKSCGF